MDNTFVNTIWQRVSHHGTSSEFAGGWMDDCRTIYGRSILEFVGFTYKYMQSIHAYITVLHVHLTQVICICTYNMVVELE